MLPSGSISDERFGPADSARIPPTPGRRSPGEAELLVSSDLTAVTSELTPHHQMRTAIEIVEAYLSGLRNGNLDRTPFAPDLTYESPLLPKMTGEAAIQRLSSLLPELSSIRVKRHIVEG